MNIHTENEIPESIDSYVRHRLLQHLGFARKRFFLKPANAGLHSRVFFLDIEDEQPLVLKIIPKRNRFRSIISCSRYLFQKGVPVPEIVCAHEDNRFFNRRGMHVMCEERILGETLRGAERTPELIRHIAKFFARMHANTRDAWGSIYRGRQGELFNYLYVKSERKVQAWCAVNKTVPDRLRTKILAAMKSWRSAIDRIAVFSLSHGDPNPNNIIVSTGSKQLFLLDVGTVRYLPRAIDYYMLQGFFCFNNRAHETAFDAAYFHALSVEEQHAFNTTNGFFKLYVLILFMHDLAIKFPKITKDSPYYDEFITMMPQVKNAITEIVDV